MILTREQALRVSRRAFVNVNVPELDGDLRLASLAAGPALKFAELNERKSKGEHVQAEMMRVLIKHAVVDEKGEQLFDDAAADAFIDKISLDTLTLITNSVPKATDAKAEGADVGNSKANTVAG